MGHLKNDNVKGKAEEEGKSNVMNDMRGIPKSSWRHCIASFWRNKNYKNKQIERKNDKLKNDNVKGKAEEEGKNNVNDRDLQGSS